jgi:hypothetical protein
MAARASACVWLVLCAVGCSYDLRKHQDSCSHDTDCGSGTHCKLSFCVVDLPMKTDSPDPAASGAPDPSNSPAGSECESTAAPEACYEGGPNTEGVGACRAGMRFCVSGAFTRCLDQVIPTAESCNGIDDDCNDVTDDIASQSCEVTGSIGGCGAAGTIVCRDGAASCELSEVMSVETCNGADDDCDGKTDEDFSGACFPVGATGCVDNEGEFDCRGVCVTGTRSCNSGMERCSGATTAGVEKCGGNPALDEDCDGTVDENCPCSAGSSQNCYGGPPTAIANGGIGPCGPGTQSCNSGTMGPCTSQSLPVAENCANQGKDDDCNGTLDDVKGLGEPCTDTTAHGTCRAGTLQCSPGATSPVCVGGDPSPELCDTIDQDCDGNPVNGFDLNSQQRCGSCDVGCSDTQMCCGGVCVAIDSLDSDEANCGGCGSACGSLQYCCEGNCYNPTWSSWNQPPPQANCCTQSCGSLTCCGTVCADLVSDLANCGACGNACPEGTKACRSGQCR